MSAPDPQDVTHLVACLLSVERGEDGDVGSSRGEGSELHTQFVSRFSKDNDHIEFSCPAMSLVHDDPLNFNHENPKEAEKSAFQLLSRPMGFEFAGETSNLSQGELTYEKLVEVRSILLMNISESFALLVDSRLRAHGTFMEMHGLSVAEKKVGESGGLDQKLQTLLEIGNRVTVGRTKVKVNVRESRSATKQMASSDVSFEVLMELHTDSVDEAPSTYLNIRFEAQGSLKAFSSSSRWDVKLEVDTSFLLSQMKASAAEVVSRVVDITNALFGCPDQSFGHRKSSTAALPSDQESTSESRSLSTNNQALVSPDFSAFSHGQEIPHMMLNDEVSEASDLSPDQCASILDDVFEDVDIAVFSSSPSESTQPADRDYRISRPQKKMRTAK